MEGYGASTLNLTQFDHFWFHPYIAKHMIARSANRASLHPKPDLLLTSPGHRANRRIHLSCHTRRGDLDIYILYSILNLQIGPSDDGALPRHRHHLQLSLMSPP